MSKMLRALLDKATGINIEDLRGPTTPVGKEEVVLGILPDDLKALWFVMNEAEGRHKEVCAKLHTKSFKLLDKGEQKRLSLEHARALLEHELALEVLMVEAVASLGDKMDVAGIGLREEWKIVEAPMPGISALYNLVLHPGGTEYPPDAMPN